MALCCGPHGHQPTGQQLFGDGQAGRDLEPAPCPGAQGSQTRVETAGDLEKLLGPFGHQGTGRGQG